MKTSKKIKVAVKHGKTVVVGTLTPPEKSYGRWTGSYANGVTVTGDTAEECADKLGETSR